MKIARFLLTMSLIALFMVFPFLIHAQDTAAAHVVSAASQSQGASWALSLLSGLVHWPTWLSIVIGAVSYSLILAQWILKRIPTPKSVVIGSWVGAILSWITAFQADVLHEAPTTTAGVPS